MKNKKIVILKRIQVYCHCAPNTRHATNPLCSVVRFLSLPVLWRLQLSIVLQECDTCGNLDVPAFNTSGKLYQASHGQVNRAPAWCSS